MRVAGVLLAAWLAVGCRQLFGIDDTAVATDAPAVPPADARPDGPDAFAGPDAGWVTIVIRQGESGYGGSLDTHIREAAPATGHGASNTVVWDGGAGQAEHGLLQFQDLFGVDRIPPGATIVSAILEIEISNDSVLPAGTVSEVAIAWDESTTWNTFGALPGVQPGDVGLMVATAPHLLGAAVLDVTQSLRAWAADPEVNHGWIFTAAPGNAEDCGYRSIENGPRRPFLTVTFVP